MTEAAAIDAYGILTEPATLRMQRLLPGSIERVWAYLTESDLRRQWLAAGEMELETGAPFEFVWRHDELSRERAERPAGMPEESRMDCRITEIDPPRRIAFTWSGTGDVSIELSPAGDGVLLTLVHRRLPSREYLLRVAAGWHSHLDILVDRVGGMEPKPIWPAWSRLHAEYDQRLPA